MERACSFDAALRRAAAGVSSSEETARTKRRRRRVRRRGLRQVQLQLQQQVDVAGGASVNLARILPRHRETRRK